MDYFKIITLIFMIVICYKVFLIDGTISENFESTPSIADDWNAVNQLAQISRQLMNGTLTVPGGLTVSSLNVNGNAIIGSLSSNVHTMNGHLNVTYGGNFTGNLNVNNGNFCIGNTCISESELGVLKGSLQNQINNLSSTVNNLSSTVTTNNNNAVKWNSGIQIMRQNDSKYTQGDGFAGGNTGGQCNSWTKFIIKDSNHGYDTGGSGNC